MRPQEISRSARAPRRRFLEGAADVSPRFSSSTRFRSPFRKVSLAVSREKEGKLRLVYAGWDDVKVVLLGTSPLAEADSGHS